MTSTTETPSSFIPTTSSTTNDDTATTNADNINHNHNSSSSSLLSVSSSDVIRLIMAHLMECGLYDSCRAIRDESGIGLCSSTYIPNQFWYYHCSNGNWGILLDSLSYYDKEKVNYLNSGNTTKNLDYVIGCIHEMVILELADIGEWELAYSTYRLVQNQLSDIHVTDADENENNDNDTKSKSKKRQQQNTSTTSTTIARRVEQKLAELANLRMKQKQEQEQSAKNNDTPTSSSLSIPNNYYNGSTKQQRRDYIGKMLEEMIPRQPKNRLVSLLQQAIKWQSYTGQIPYIQRILEADNNDNADNNDENDDSKKRRKHDDTTCSKKGKKTIKEFDLVVGEVNVKPMSVDDDDENDFSNYGNNNSKLNAMITKSIQNRSYEKYSTIKFGKNVTPEVAIFLCNNDDNTNSLITGSSDGLIEIWDSRQKYTSLLDLPYQQQEQFLCHEVGITALSVSNDGQMIASGDKNGMVHIWKFNNGLLLRSISAHTIDHTILYLSFTPDSSRILTASTDCSCREFSLRTGRMLNEYRGHTSYVSVCHYHIPNLGHDNANTNNNTDDNIGFDNNGTPLLVITGSGDGTVRIWNGKTADIIHVLRPISIGQQQSVLSKVGDTVCIPNYHLSINSVESNSPTINSVLFLHTPNDTMIIVPRGQRAFLINCTGHVIMTYDISNNISINSSTNDAVFVTATMSPNNRILYIIQDNGICCVFNVISGELVRTIHNFGEVTSKRSTKTTTLAGANNDAMGGNKVGDANPVARAPEISSIIHHPTKNIIASFSNDKGQSKGQLVLWK